MKDLKKEEILNIIKNKEFEKLIGLKESEFLEVKENFPYNLEKLKDFFELLKDVSAFANSEGGVIIYGMKTIKPEGKKIEIINEIKLIEKENFDRKKIETIKGIIRTNIYPEIKSVEIDWISSKNDPQKGIVYIYIPPQKEKYFLANKIIDEKTGDKAKAIFFGLFTRRGDKNEHLTVKEIHQIIKRGSSKTEERLSAIENKINFLIDNVLFLEKLKNDEKRVKFMKDEIKSVIDNIEKEKPEIPLFVLSIIPKGKTSLKKFFSKKKDSIYYLFFNPPKIREKGWDLSTYKQPELIKGEYYIANNYENIIIVYRNGLFIVEADIVSDFLGWGSSKSETKINDISIIEFIVNILLFYKEIEKLFETKIEKVMINIQLKNLKTKNVYMVEKEMEFIIDKKNAPENSFNKDLEFEIEKIIKEYKSVAFEIIREIYGWFGIAEEKIPYTKIGANNSLFIDIDKIKEA